MSQASELYYCKVAVLDTTNSISINGGAFQVSGGMSVAKTLSIGNTLLFPSINLAGPPTIGTRSNGTKAILFPNITATTGDYALGIESNAMWLSTTDASGSFNFYGGQNRFASITGGQSSFWNSQMAMYSSGSAFFYMFGSGQGSQYWNFGTPGLGSAFYIQANFGNGVALGWGGTTWSSVSDIRLKSDIVPIESKSALDTIVQLNPITYLWADKTTDNEQRKAGLIAQEVQPLIPDIIETIERKGEEYMSLRYTEIIPYLIAAVKALKEENSNLEKRLTNAGL